jgi:hypothetical protein
MTVEERMKALLCTAFGPLEHLVLREIASPRPGSNQVLIDVKAASLNFPDATMVVQIHLEERRVRKTARRERVEVVHVDLDGAEIRELAGVVPVRPEGHVLEASLVARR